MRLLEIVGFVFAVAAAIYVLCKLLAAVYEMYNASRQMAALMGSANSSQFSIWDMAHFSLSYGIASLAVLMIPSGLQKEGKIKLSAVRQG
ncbi:hypothetical protein [Rhizobium sullae]|uniref:hypothetical protein n=1 Tax=Rhizobium sullae TaxID=50338 RepID=UPI000B350B02|nr:hypothetical protein [Rhizobium sullae]